MSSGHTADRSGDDRPRHGRLPWPTRDELSEEARELYDGILSGPRGKSALIRRTDADGRLHGPFNSMLMSPIIGEALQQVGSRIRYSGTLPDRVRELSILLLAGVYRSDFERYAHEPVARALGCTDEELAAAWRGELPATSEGLERTVLETVLSLLDAHDLDETEYANAHGALGDAGLVELIVLVGYYELLATLLTVFRAPVPDPAEER